MSARRAGAAIPLPLSAVRLATGLAGQGLAAGRQRT